MLKLYIPKNKIFSVGDITIKRIDKDTMSIRCIQSIPIVSGTHETPNYVPGSDTISTTLIPFYDRINIGHNIVIKRGNYWHVLIEADKSLYICRDINDRPSKAARQSTINRINQKGYIPKRKRRSA